MDGGPVAVVSYCQIGFASVDPVAMGPLALILIGMATVIAGIVVFRVHPFVILIAAALLVACLTPEEAVYRARLSPEAAEQLFGNGDGGMPTDPAMIRPDLADPAAADPTAREAHRAATAASSDWFVSRVTKGFGEGCAQIGVLIAMASLIGRCLLDSGAARRIVETLVGLLGFRRVPVALASSSFLLGIPVFFDTVFYLMVPLARALRARSGKDYLLYVLAIVAGATMAHSLVPPTPGPLMVATFFGDRVTVGAMMLGGLAVGMVTVSVGVCFAYWANRRWEIPFDEDAGEGDSSGTESVGTEGETGMPPFWLSLLPVVLPLLLIGGHMIYRGLGGESSWFRALGDKNLALMLSAAVAVWMLVRAKAGRFGGSSGEAGEEKAPGRNAVKTGTGKSLSPAIQEALAGAGVIILITAAGSAFGGVLRDTGIAASMRAGSFVESSAYWLLLLAYGITAVVRTAQGSATVAMITAGGMIGPMALAIDLPYSPLYLALAIGCGSKPVSWANDSGFWVIGRMAGMSPVRTFQTVSVMMVLMSLAGLAVVLLGAWLLPLR